MPSTMFVGKPGTSKTARGVMLAFQRGGRIVSDIPLDVDAAKKLADDGVIPPHEIVIKKPYAEQCDDYGCASAHSGRGDSRTHWKVPNVGWEDFNDLYDVMCATVLGDEIALRLDARKYDSMPVKARKKIILHRQDHNYLIFTAQDVSFVDKIYRLMMDDIEDCSIVEKPFIAWRHPERIRPDLVCGRCGLVIEPGTQSLWVADDRTQGVRKSRWRQIWGYGTVFRSTIHDFTEFEKPVEMRVAKGEQEVFYDHRIIALYDTHGASKNQGDRGTDCGHLTSTGTAPQGTLAL